MVHRCHKWRCLLRFVTVLDVTLLFCAVTQPVFAFDGTSAMCDERREILRIASEEVARRWPQSLDMTTSLPAVIIDRGNSWFVYYDLPPGVRGGTPEITIDKNTCRIINAAHGQ